MSRRDTIIIAVLINAGLLLVLFTTALPSKEESESDSVLSQVVEEIDVVTTQASKTSDTIAIVPTDEVDMVLSEWNIKPGEGTLEVATESPIKLKTPELDDKSSTSIVALSEEAKAFASSDYLQVTVKKGDALEKIAKANNTTVQEITKLNQLSSSSTLQVGQVLKVPKKKDAEIASKKDAEVSSKKEVDVAKSTKKKSAEKKELNAKIKSSDKDQYYTVKSGDSPWLIASKNDIKLEDLLKLNNLDDTKARKLKPGDRIRIK
jgi:peptidoglycan endopeptidase LytF